jgi:hypothetical protein
MSNIERLEAAKEAASNYHADQSVSIRTTMEGLEELLSHVESLVDACAADLAARGEE